MEMLAKDHLVEPIADQLLDYGDDLLCIAYMNTSGRLGPRRPHGRRRLHQLERTTSSSGPGPRKKLFFVPDQPRRTWPTAWAWISRSPRAAEPPDARRQLHPRRRRRRLRGPRRHRDDPVGLVLRRTRCSPPRWSSTGAPTVAASSCTPSRHWRPCAPRTLGQHQLPVGRGPAARPEIASRSGPRDTSSATLAWRAPSAGRHRHLRDPRISRRRMRCATMSRNDLPTSPGCSTFSGGQGARDQSCPR